MATKHTVRTSGEVSGSGATSKSGAGKKDAQFSDDPTDVSHLRPLSEGVLHRSGLHDGVDDEGQVRDLRGEMTGAFDIDPSDLPSDEPHVLKLRLEHQFGGIVERRVETDGSVVLALIHGDGDITTAKGATTVVALHALIEKMGGLK